MDVASLVTRRTGSIQGMVTLANGQSPEGCDVFVGGTTMVGKASEKGRFALANVPEGIWDVVLQKPGFDRAVLKGIVVKAGQPIVISEPVTLAAESGGLAGVKAAIRDSSGKAIVGATITVYTADGASTTATSDGQGNVSVSNLPDGEYTIQVYRPFFQPVPGLKATVQDGKLTDLGEIKLQSTTMYFGQASGQVIDEYGDPVDGAVVMLDPPVTEQVFTDAQGRFTLDRIMPGEYTLHVAAGGMEVSSTQLRLDNAPNTKVTYDAPILMRQTPGAGRGDRHATLLPPLPAVGSLSDNRVVLFWEPPAPAQYPEGIVSLHHEVHHLDDAVGSVITDPVNGDWKPVADKADATYVLADPAWNQDMFRVRAVGLDAQGRAYVSAWQELSLRGPGAAQPAGYRLLAFSKTVYTKATIVFPDLKAGKPNLGALGEKARKAGVDLGAQMLATLDAFNKQLEANRRPGALSNLVEAEVLLQVLKSMYQVPFVIKYEYDYEPPQKRNKGIKSS